MFVARWAEINNFFVAYVISEIEIRNYSLQKLLISARR